MSGVWLIHNTLTLYPYNANNAWMSSAKSIVTVAYSAVRSTSRSNEHPDSTCSGSARKIYWADGIGYGCKGKSWDLTATITPNNIYFHSVPIAYCHHPSYQVNLYIAHSSRLRKYTPEGSVHFANNTLLWEIVIKWKVSNRRELM